MASGSDDRKVILWNIHEKKEIATLEGHTNYVYTVAFNPSGRILASGSLDQMIILWNVDTKEKITTLNN